MSSSMNNFTNEDLISAKSVSLSALAEILGFHLVRAGRNVSLQEHDSLVIFNDSTWHRFSGKGIINSGSTIDFMLEFGGADSIVDAVLKINEIFGNVECRQASLVKKKKNKEKKTEKKDFFFQPDRRTTAICMLIC